MKRGTIIIAALAAIVLVCAVLPRGHKPGIPTGPATAPPQQANRIESLSGEFKPAAPMPLVTNYTRPRPPLVAVPKADLNVEEIAQLQWLFSERFKPAIQKWSQAYAGRIPFNPESVTLNNLHSRLGDLPGRYIYTFMVDSSTLSIMENDDGRYAVAYLSAPDASKLSDLHAGQTPTVTLPVTKEEVITMVKADIGEEFPAEQVTIRPTGLACAVNGGAFVKAGWLFPNDKDNAMRVVDLVIGPDGKLITYCSEPFHKLHSGQPPKSPGKSLTL